MLVTSTSAERHSFSDDLHALLIGTSFSAFGLVLLKAAGLVTGGVAGMALIASYATGLPVGGLFVAFNLPFLLAAWRRLGLAAAMRSIIAMAILGAFVAIMPTWLRLTDVAPAFASLFGGSLIGMGMLSLARHRSSVGGVSILALMLQEQRGWSAGAVQMVVDVVVLAASLVVLNGPTVGFSILSAVAQSLVVFYHHRPGRYTGS